MPAPQIPLVDLNQFGIHVNNPVYVCCRCKKPIRGHSEGIHADDLCAACYYVKGIPPERLPWPYANRRDLYFYTARTMWVMDPQVRQSHVRAIWAGQLLNPAYTALIAVVKIDGVLYTTRGTGSVNLYQGNECVRRDALHIEERQLRAVLARQRPSA